MEDKAKAGDDHPSRLWAELEEKTKDDPELAKHLEAAKHVIEKYRETLQRLADS